MVERKKIIVIADDFTGAAEISGIGLRHGLSVAIETQPIDSPEIDLLVLATDTRSLDPEEAKIQVQNLTKQVIGFKPYLIYKKIDSVLRGNVSEELVAQLDEMNVKRSIVIAGNPIFNRIIKGGKYFIDNVALDKTCFSTDSQHPRTSNNLLELLTPSDNYPVSSAKKSDNLPEQGIIMGDVESIEDLLDWTKYFSNDTLFAGASGFFNSLLSHLKISKHEQTEKYVPYGSKRLFVLGSSYPKNSQTIQAMVDNDHYHTNMPGEVFHNTANSTSMFIQWTEEIVSAFKRNQKVIISSIHISENNSEIFKRIKKQMAEVVKIVANRVTLDEILVEGGSTTSEILDQLNITRLTPVQELDTGVIRMEVADQPGLCITTKPGSYIWPEKLWKSDKIKYLNKNIIKQDTLNE